MTYFGFLALFLLIPIGTLAVDLWRMPQPLPKNFRAYPAHLVIAAHVLVAVVYTTPWDNYLVATRVWWYDPELVNGLTIWYVPIEEYSFFVLQTVMTGMWVVWLMRRNVGQSTRIVANMQQRKVSVGIAAVVWVLMAGVLISGWRPGTYLALELTWALIPIGIQLAFGADILWGRRRLLFWGIVPPTLYLSVADALAIESGTWTISPTQSTGIMLFDVLPIEEFVFFIITNVLVVFGCTLVMSAFSRVRFEQLVARFRPNSSVQHEQ